MRNIWKVTLLCFLLFIFGGSFYLYKLHELAIEGNKIFECRCLNVNPQLIGYKTTFLKFADQVNNPDWADSNQMMSLIISYIGQMKSYVEAEDRWLVMDKSFINRWDYKLIEPWYIQRAGYLQWKMYEGYHDDAANILSLWNHPEQAKMPTDSNYVSEPKQRRDKYIDEYHTFFQQAVMINDWRKFFGRAPISKDCTKENLEIPNTSGSIQWNTDSGSSPSAVPIDPYGMS